MDKREVDRILKKHRRTTQRQAAPILGENTPLRRGWKKRLASLLEQGVTSPVVNWEEVRKPRARRVPAEAVGPGFYDTWGWKRARMEALRRYGRRCMCCGWTPGDGPGFLAVDHIKPLALHPHLALAQDNLQVLCNDCNMGKCREEDDFR